MLGPILFYNFGYLLLGICISCIFLIFFLFGTTRYNFSFTDDIHKIYGGSSHWYYITLLLICILNLCFFSFLAHPYLQQSNQIQKRQTLDIEIVFDLSNSMLAEDIIPSRLSVARKVLQDFVVQVKDARLGIILFAGKPFIGSPLTFDTKFLRQFVSEIEVETINQSQFDMAGTAIGDGLLLASEILGKEKKDTTKEQVIILMTDGEANKGIDPLLALKKVKQENIKVYTIGVGKDENTSIILLDTFSGFPQTIPVGPVDEETLKKISSETGSKYYRADSESNLREIFRDIQELERAEIVYELRNQDTSLRIYILVCSIFFLFFLIVVHIYKPIRF